MSYIRSLYGKLNDDIINQLADLAEKIEADAKTMGDQLYKIASARSTEYYAKIKEIRESAVWTYNVRFIDKDAIVYYWIERTTDAPIENPVQNSRTFMIINHVLVFSERQMNNAQSYYATKWMQRMLTKEEEQAIKDGFVPESFTF